MEFIYTFNLLDFLTGYVFGFLFLIILFLFKLSIRYLIDLNLKQLEFIITLFKYFSFRKIINRSSKDSIIFYSPAVDKKNINCNDLIKDISYKKYLFKKTGKTNYLKNPLQIQDDDLIKNLDIPFIYYNPETLEVYGSFFTLDEDVKYFKARLEIAEDYDRREPK